ncbi:hypothetical protein [Bounagaea algeriensis]
MSEGGSADGGAIDTSAVQELPGIKQGAAIGKAVSGDQVDLSAVQSGVAELASDALSFATNPASWLINKGLGFLMDFVKPIEEAIQAVSGDKESLSQGSAEFAEVQQQLNQLAQNLLDTVQTGTTDWNGEAAEAARAKIAEFSEGVHNTGKQAHNLSEILRMSSTLAEAAEGAIRGILADFITWLIMTWVPALASAGPTLGGSTAAAGAATSVEASIAVANTSRKIKRIIDILNDVVNAITMIKAALDTVRANNAMEAIKSGDANTSGGHKKASDELNAEKNTLKATQDALKYEQAQLDPTPTTNAQGGTSIDPGQTAYDGAMKTMGHYGNAASNAADGLEKQASEGGFSNVPADQKIEGQLEF